MSRAVRITTAAGTPATAETITTAETQRKPTSAITSATTVSVAKQDYYGMLAMPMQ